MLAPLQADANTGGPACLGSVCCTIGVRVVCELGEMGGGVVLGLEGSVGVLP